MHFIPCQKFVESQANYPETGCSSWLRTGILNGVAVHVPNQATATSAKICAENENSLRISIASSHLNSSTLQKDGKNRHDTLEIKRYKRNTSEDELNKRWAQEAAHDVAHEENTAEKY